MGTKRRDRSEARFGTDEQATPRLSLETRVKRGTRLVRGFQGARREAGLRRPVPVRLRQAVSRGAA